jgi:hypothetical protein
VPEPRTVWMLDRRTNQMGLYVDRSDTILSRNSATSLSVTSTTRFSPACITSSTRPACTSTARLAWIRMDWCALMMCNGPAKTFNTSSDAADCSTERSADWLMAGRGACLDGREEGRQRGLP